MDEKTYSYTEEEISIIRKIAENLPYHEVITNMSDGYVAESKALARILEPSCCKLLSELMRQADFYEKYPKKYTEFAESGWFYCSPDYVEMNIGMVERTQQQTLNKLKSDGLLEVGFGINKKRKVRLNKSKIVSLIIGCQDNTFDPLDFEDTKTLTESKSIAKTENATNFAKIYEIGLLQNWTDDMVKSMGLNPPFLRNWDSEKHTPYPPFLRNLYNIKQYIFFSINKFILKNTHKTTQSGGFLATMKKKLVKLEENKPDIKITGVKEKKKNNTCACTRTGGTKQKLSKEEQLEVYLACVEKEVSQTFGIYDKHKLKVIVNWFDSIWDKGVCSTKRGRFATCIEELDKYMKEYSWDKLKKLLITCTLNAYCSLEWGVNKNKQTQEKVSEAKYFDKRKDETLDEYAERRVREYKERDKNGINKLTGDIV